MWMLTYGRFASCMAQILFYLKFQLSQRLSFCEMTSTFQLGEQCLIKMCYHLLSMLHPYKVVLWFYSFSILFWLIHDACFSPIKPIYVESRTGSAVSIFTKKLEKKPRINLMICAMRSQTQPPSKCACVYCPTLNWHKLTFLFSSACKHTKILTDCDEGAITEVLYGNSMMESL